MKRAPWLLFLVAAAVYFNCLPNDFTQDDFIYIVYNKQVLQPSWRLWVEPYSFTYLYRPLGTLSYLVNYALGDLEPVWFHLLNILLHAGVTVLFYFLARELSDGPPAALAATLLFALHPIHSEAVAAMVGRTELLAAGFLMGAWLLHLGGRFWTAALCFLLALLSKESAAAFLVLAPLGDYVRRRLRPAAYARYASAFAVFFLLRWNALRGLGPNRLPMLDNPLVELPPLWRVLNALCVAWKYLALQLFPATLSADYSFNAIPLLRSWTALLPALLGTALLLGLWSWSFRRHAGVFLAGAIYLAGFALTSNVLFPIGTIMGERLAYLPSAGLCLLAGLGWERLARHGGRRKAAAVAGLAVIAAVLGARTVVRNRDWHDNFTLFAATVKAVPESARARHALGSAYLERRDLERARRQLETAYRILPEYAALLGSLGLLYLQLGERERAEKIMESAVPHVGPDHADYNAVANFYASILIGSGRHREALAVLDRVIAVAPRFSRAYSNRAMARYLLHDREGARADAEAALRLDPDNGQAHSVLNLLKAPERNPFSSGGPRSAAVSAASARQK